MSFFNTIYTLGRCQRAQLFEKNTEVKIITQESRDTCAKITRWLSKIIWYPIQMVHAAYNTADILLHKDINTVVAHQISERNSIHYMPFLIGKSGHIITSSSVINAVARQFRHDINGLFTREAQDPLISIFRDLYPECEINEEDLLMSCSHEHVNKYRTPLLKFLGGENLASLKSQIQQIADTVVDSFIKHSPVSAKALAETYTVAIFAHLFFNLPGTMEDFQNIAKAFSSMTEYQFIKKWGKTTKDQTKQYQTDLTTFKAAIDASSGEFRKSLSSSGLSPIQVKGELLLTYGAGSETTSSVLQHVLWRIGQDPILQEAIFNGSQQVEDVLSSSLKQYTPASLISRFARTNLEIVVTNQNGTSWKYPISKGDALVIAPVVTHNMFFGVGKHACPGQKLAYAEIDAIVRALIKKFKITSFPKTDLLKTIPGVGFVKLEPVQLSFTTRK